MFRTMYHLLLLLTFLVPGACQSGYADIGIVTNGSSSYVIVLPDEPTQNETKAAKVLQNYLKRLSGANLNIVAEKNFRQSAGIFIGATEHTADFNSAKPVAEAFFIGTDNKNLYIRGGSGKGVLYGVYTLLENYFGCRKYSAEPTFVPSSKTLTLPQRLMDKQEPVFMYREVTYPSSYDDEFLEWNKLHRFEDLWGLWAHSYFKMLPPKTYFSTHPEYYALNNGKRQPTQLCLSNEDVFNLSVAYLRKAMAAHPDALYWSISQEDNAGFCRCDQCLKANREEGGWQGPVIRFVNRIAAQFPDKQFATLAYLYSSHPPKKTKPAPNVYIMLSTINASRHEPLATSPSAAEFRQDLAGWKALTDKIFVWDYTTDFSSFLAPFPDYDHLQPNIQYLKAQNVKGIFSQGSADSYSDMATYNCYLLAKLLWTPSLDDKKLTTDFLNGYYGKAGPYIGQYMNALSNNVGRTNTRLGIYDNPVNKYKSYLSADAMDQYKAILDKAENAVANDSVLLKRVQTATLSVEYTALQQSRFYGTEKKGYMVAMGRSYAVDPKFPARVSKFIQKSKAAGVKEYSEGGVSPNDYLNQWLVLFTHKWDNSLALHASVSLKNPFSDDYPAKGAQTLTDGMLGDNDFSLNWLFFYGTDMVATIDLGDSKTINQVKMNFLQDAKHFIFNPTNIVLETSQDGRNFKTVGKQQPDSLQEGDYTIKPNNFIFKVSSVQARYVRVTATCLPAMPAWRIYGNRKPAVCCDEITVL